MILRDYQQRAIDELRAMLLRGQRRLLLVAPTGAGKTVIASEMIRSAVSRATLTLFLAHRKELIDQPSRKLDELGIDHGILMSDHPRARPWLPIQVASIPTLARRLDRLPKAGLIIVDEAHHARAESYGKILDAYPGVPVIGLTATPWRTDGRGLGDVFEAMYLVATPSQLCAEGWLTPVTGFAYETPDLSGVKRTAGDYNERELGVVMGGTRIVGNIVERWLQYARELRTVVFAVHVEHSKQLTAEFRAAGVAAEHLDATTPREEREAVFARLHSGETRVLCNVGICTEGWDEPLLGCVVLARPTLSVCLAIQMIGRGRRPAPGKTVLRLHDHAGCVIQHGLPDEERDWSLTADVRRKRGEKLLGVRTCSSCFALYAPTLGTCPVCGAENPKRVRMVKTTDGREVTLEQLREEQRKSRPKGYGSRNAALAAAYREIAAECRRKGHKPNAAKMRFHARFHVWPLKEWDEGGEHAA